MGRRPRRFTAKLRRGRRTCMRLRKGLTSLVLLDLLQGVTHWGHERRAEAAEVGALDREVEEEGRQPGAFEAQADLATGIRTTHRLISRCMLTWIETRSWGRPSRRLSPGKILLMPSWKAEVRRLVEAAATHSVREREQEDGEAEGDVVPKEEEKISQQRWPLVGPAGLRHGTEDVGERFPSAALTLHAAELGLELHVVTLHETLDRILGIFAGREGRLRPRPVPRRCLVVVVDVVDPPRRMHSLLPAGREGGYLLLPSTHPQDEPSMRSFPALHAERVSDCPGS
mmetsp:Transcript_35567/g.111267  ORF Transcript_35567/g.111267 Transcript_35567/m.111267 type:complete len:285 (+) Transcript_35567:2201-3055(+)